MTFGISSPDPINQLLCDLLCWDKTRWGDLEKQLAGLDWSDLVWLATGHQLVVLVYRRLRLLVQQGRAPQEALKKLHDLYLAQVGASLRRSHWLGQTLQELRARGIPVAALKGAYLAEAVYADVAERQMVDVDLLVRREYLENAVQALTVLGYQPSKEFWLDVELRAAHELPAFLKAGATPIELHWTLIHPELPFQVDLEGLWQRMVPAQIAGQPSLGLCPEDLLLHLCMHAAAQHRFQNGLRNTYDVAASVARFGESLDWKALIRRSKEWRAERAIFLMLWLAVDLYSAPLPEEVLHQLQPTDFDSETAELARRLVLALPHEQSAFPPRLAELSQAANAWERARLVWRQFFLSTQEMARRYPVRPDSWRVFLYYPVRWRELFVRRARMAWGLLLRNPQTLAQAEARSARLEEEEQLIGWVVGSEGI